MILEEESHPLLADQEILMVLYHHVVLHTIELEVEQELPMAYQTGVIQMVHVQEHPSA